MKRPLLWIAIAFVLGEVTSKYSANYRMYILAGTIISAVLVIVSIKSKRRFEKLKGRLFVFVLTIVSFLAGFLLVYSQLEKHNSAFLDEEAGSLKKWNAVVKKVTKKDYGYQYVLLIRDEKILCNLYLDSEKSFGDAGVNADETVYANPGQKLLIEGRIAKLEPAANPGEFDKKEYYESKGIFYQLKDAGLISVSGRPSYVKLWIGYISDKVCEGIDRVFPENEAGIMKTMITGNSGSLDEETKLLYQKNGIAHILAISGLHAALIGRAVLYLLRCILGLSAKLSAGLSIILIIGYGAFTGFSAATVRAVIMLCIIYLGDAKDRNADTLNSLAVSYMILSFVEPLGLFGSGFQLSFAAVVGTAVSNKVFKKLYKSRMRGRNKYYVWFLKNLFTMLFVNAMTLPIILNTYYEIPLYSVLLSILVVVLLSTAIICGILAALLALVPFAFFTVSGELVSKPAYLILKLYDVLCRFILKLPGAVLNTGHPRVYVTIIYYILIAAVLYVFLRGRREGRVRRDGEWLVKYWLKNNAVILTILFIISLFGAVTYLFNLLERRIVFLSVGQGDCAIIRTDTGRNYIVDGGSTSNEKCGAYIIIPALKYYGMSDIDGVFISHTDNDHVNGIIYLVENLWLYKLKLDTIYLSEGTMLDENLEKLKEASDGTINIRALSKENSGIIADDNITVLYPSEKLGIDVQGNERSLVLRLISCNKEVIFCGDIGEDTEKEVSMSLSEIREFDSIRDNRITYRIIKIPHHGSKYSSSEGLLDSFQGNLAVISVGKNNSYGHPTKEAMDRMKNAGLSILRTDEKGAIIIKN